MNKILSRSMLLLVMIAGIAWLVWPRPQAGDQAAIDGLAVTPGPGYARATGPIPFSFPSDYGAHPDFQTEWWYYTGNLQSAAGDHYGFQLTIFRRSLLPGNEQQVRTSDWATNQVYMAHLTLTDVKNNTFRYFERFSRGAAGLAGAEGSPAFKVWLDDWQVNQTGSNLFHLSATESDLSLDLNFQDLKGVVLQGDQGYSQKGAQPGNASYYFSQTRLETSGSLRLGNNSFSVTGLSWMDHEYSTSALGTNEVGWDWFAIQLDDGSELTIYFIRQKDGTTSPYARGMIVRPDGTTRSLDPQNFKISKEATWKSPHSGADYPALWTIEVPSESLVLHVRPYVADQELRVSFTYWEGAVEVDGLLGTKKVTGSGYVELTGYAQSLQGQF